MAESAINEVGGSGQKISTKFFYRYSEFKDLFDMIGDISKYNS